MSFPGTGRRRRKPGRADISHRELLREGERYAGLCDEQSEGGGVMADGSVRKREKLPG